MVTHVLYTITLMVRLNWILGILLSWRCAVNAAPADSPMQPPAIFSETTLYPLPNPGDVAVHDPNIVHHNGAYYLFRGGVHIPILKATSLDGPWDGIGTVLDGPSRVKKENRTRPWAPTTVVYNNRFYCFYTVSRHGSRNSAIGVASADSIEGNWTDHGELISTEKGPHAHIWPYSKSNAIDAAFITDQQSGKPYLLYGSFWHGIFQVPLTDDLLSVEDPDHPDAKNLAFLPDEKVMPEEGSFMSYHEPYYYLWFSHGKCCRFPTKGFPVSGKEYEIRVGRSTNVRGPFIDKNGVPLMKGGGTTVYASNRGVVYAPGGVGVISGNASNATDVLYYHYLNTSIGFTDDVSYTSDPGTGRN
ncbi:glycosyl hydrolase [Aspergillus ambiguus]|uniref:endo 1,5-alpha-arabinase n=1 Tax=Aspergillus ambiguus TaxID=176160 RepID=UPI003CCD3EDB